MTFPATPSRPNLPLGVGAAAVGALVGAFLWALLVSVTNYKIGYAAVGVGALAGFLAGRFGGGHPALPPIAAVIGLVGCIIGDVFTDAHQLAKELTDLGQKTSATHVLSKMLQDPSGLGWEVYKAGFDGIDVLFYAFAALAAFRLATAHGLLHQQAASAPTLPPPAGPPAPMAPPADPQP